MIHNLVNDRLAKPLLFVGTVMSLQLAASPVLSGPDIAKGESLVRANCAPCHAVGLTDNSPHPDAPALRTLSERYPINSLEEALAEGISTGHPDMPQFVVPPNEIGAIIGYIESLQSK